MIQFFLKNEAAINFVCFTGFLTIMLMPRMFNKTISGLLDILFLIAFSMCFLSVLINGFSKGF